MLKFVQICNLQGYYQLYCCYFTQKIISVRFDKDKTLFIIGNISVEENLDGVYDVFETSWCPMVDKLNAATLGTIKQGRGVLSIASLREPKV